jgi:hypothetical protein
LVRDRIVERAELTGHDGASGALLERARLDDGSALVLKTFDPGQDLSMRIAGRTVPLDVALWQAGVLERLPSPIGHAVVDAWQEHGWWVLAMRDLEDRLLDYRSVISRAQCRRILAAANAMHDEFDGVHVDGLWPLERRLVLFSPQVMTPYVDAGNPLPGWCLDGWRVFEDLAPRDVVDLVRAVHDRPGVLADPLARRGGQTLLHGDYWLPNTAPEPDRVVAIDWGLTTAGPPVAELTSFLVGCAGQVEASREDILDDFRELRAERHDEDLLRLGLVFGVVEMGWNLALAASEHPDRRADLDWWVAAAQRAMVEGLVGPP